MKGIFNDSSSFTKLCLLALIVFLSALIAIGISSVYMLMANNPNNTESIRIMLLIQNSFLFILSPFVAQYFLSLEPTKEALKLDFPKFSFILLGIITIIVSSPLIDVLSTWNQGLHLPFSMHAIEQWMINSEQVAENITKQMLAVSMWNEFLMNILVIAILAGIGEELLFRGVLQKIFIDWTKNIHVGIFITALIFSAIHVQFFGIVPRFVLGAILGYLFVWSGSLWTSIIAHTVNNLLVIVFTPNLLNKGNWIIEKIHTTDNSTWITSASFILVCLCLFLLYKYHNFSSSRN